MDDTREDQEETEHFAVLYVDDESVSLQSDMDPVEIIDILNQLIAGTRVYH